MESIQECLVELTSRRGLTMEAVALQVGCSSDALRRMRRGEVDNPGFHQVAALHRLAGRSLDSLVGIVADKTSPQSFDALLANALAEKMLERGLVPAAAVPLQRQVLLEDDGDDTIHPLTDEARRRLEGDLQHEEALDKAEQEMLGKWPQAPAENQATGRRRTGTK